MLRGEGGMKQTYLVSGNYYSVAMILKLYITVSRVTEESLKLIG